MIKLYFYKHNELTDLWGEMSDSPLNRIALHNYDWEEDPSKADYIIYPYVLDSIYHQYLNGNRYDLLRRYFDTIPLIKQYEAKHVFVSFADPHGLKTNLSSIFFKASVNKNCKDVNEFAIPYIIKDYPELIHYDINKIKYQFNFIGCDRSNELRLKLVSQLGKSTLVNKVETYDNFFYNKFQLIDEVISRMESYRQTIVDSLVTLCPYGKGTNTIRFFETIMLGRVPILIADDAELPFRDVINYDKFIIKVLQKDVKDINIILNSIFNQYSRGQLFYMGKYARRVYEEFFTPQMANNQMCRILESLK